MLINPAKPAAWIIVLLLALLSPTAEADVAAGVAAYQKRDYSSAIREFQAAAKRDDVRALNYLGIMYAEGVGTPRDDQQAAAMFSKAALLGFPEATANLARMHAEGRGVVQDNKAAVAAYRAAARAGFQPAIMRMAEIHEKGELGVAPDPAAAREWRARLQVQPQPAVTAAPPAVPAPVPVPAPTRKTTATAVATQPSSPPEAVADAAMAPASPARLPDRQTPAATATAPAVSALPPKTAAAVAVPRPPSQTQDQPAEAVERAASAQNAIEAVAVTLQPGQILIRVRLKVPLAAPPAGFVVAAPPRIAYDFPHTVTSLGRYHEVGAGDLQSVDVIQSGGRTRMVLILRNMMQHEVQVERRDLLITLTPAARNGN